MQSQRAGAWRQSVKRFVGAKDDAADADGRDDAHGDECQLDKEHRLRCLVGRLRDKQDKATQQVDQESQPEDPKRAIHFG